MLNTPVLLLIFNRPDPSLQLIREIKKVKPAKLYIAADGPRAHIEGEDLRCQETRNTVLNEIDWTCQIRTLFREENIGCGLGVSQAITWFLEQEEQGIILEDDCIPHQSFFHFCEELLERYRHDTRIMQISGTNFHKGWVNDPEYSYYFSEIGICWGWATWRRAWNLYDYHMQLYDEAENKGFLDTYPFFKYGKDNHVYEMIQRLKLTGALDTWDVQWNFAQYIHNGLAITPAQNLIKNVGFGEDATHTKSVSDIYKNEHSPSFTFPLKHPSFVCRDQRSDARYLRNFYSGRLMNRIKSKISKTLAFI